MIPRPLTTLLLNLLLLILYFCAGKFALSLAFLNASATAVWPNTGLALAAILLFGNRLWPAIFLGAFLVNLTTPAQPITATLILTALIIAAGNTLEALLGAYLVQRFAAGKHAFNRAPDVFRYLVFAALPSTLLCAAIGVAALRLDNASLPVWLTWWIGDFVSDLLIAPLLIIIAVAPQSAFSRKRLLEILALAILLVFVSAIIFEGGGPLHILGGRPYALAGLATPLLLWAAFRFQQRGAIAAACVMSAMAVAGTLQGVGPFATSHPNDSLLLLQSFMGVNTITALVLAAVVADRANLDLQRLALLDSERAARAQAEHANRAKDEFLAILSHELRTPLTPVMLTANLLEKDPDLPPRCREDLHHIRRNVELEARLIDDLLDITRVVRGKLQLQPQPTDLHQKLRFDADIFLPRAADITLDLAAPRHHVMGDPARLQQIFWNLLNNAVKFTPVGSPITVRTANPPDSPDSIQIQITDAGVGIDPAILPKLFRRFEQGDLLQARKFGGLGLGLSIAKALVDAHHGSISAASPGQNHGSTFTVTLPTIPTPQPADAAPTPAPAPAHPTVPLRILLVEDHLATRGVMTRLLQSLGHQVTTASTVHEALTLAPQIPLDLLISDIGLPDATGYDLLRQLKSLSPNLAPLKAIAVSGYGMDHDLALSHQAGFAAHLTKPINLNSLLTAITQATT